VDLAKYPQRGGEENPALPGHFALGNPAESPVDFSG